MANSTARPYKINVPESKIESLKTKLSLATFPDELDGAGWDLGVPLSDVKRLTKAWESFDWRRAEAKFNEELPQFEMKVKVDGFEPLDIHFIHQKSKVKNAIPLIFVHGWPGSFMEAVKLLSHLSATGGPAFHVVVPSLPNYGFSEGVSKRGFATAQYAETCHKLMLQLGYKEYVTQGGDWGFLVTRAMGALYPESVKGSHVNFIRGTQPEFLKNPILALQHSIMPYSEKEKKGLERSEWFQKEGRGYQIEQATKPQTLAYSLHDSPVGLLAWIYEKLHDWSHDYPWTDEEILTWVSIYQFSRAGPGAAHRIYYEVAHTTPGPGKFLAEDASSYIGGVPLGLCFNPMDLSVVPKTWGRTMGPIVFESDNEHGGHFHAHEHPELLAKDLKTMFGKGGGAYGVVKGLNGYDESSKL